MSAFLCFICHNTINLDTNEEIRDKYKEVVGINLCPDSHLCYICCHMLNKLWMFRSVCYKRSLEYPVLFREEGTVNLQKNDIEIHVLCSENFCNQQNKTFNILSYHYDDQSHYKEYGDKSICTKEIHDYFSLEKDENDFNVFLTENLNPKEFENVRKDEETNNKIVENGQKYHNNEEYMAVDTFNDNESPTENVTWPEIEGNDNLNPDTTVCNDTKSVTPLLEDCDKQLHTGTECQGTELIGTVITDSSMKKRKSKKHKKIGYKKITLNVAEQKAELQARRKEKKYVEAEFKCYSCGLGFLFKDSYQAHMMRHEESNGEYRCSICKLRFALPGLLRTHTTVHAERYRCGNCRVIIKPSARKTHARVCHPQTKAESVACHLCAGLFKTASGLQQHVKRFHLSKTSNRSYPCSVCGKSYNNQAAVRTHMIKHINCKFTCDQCPATFSSPYTLAQHKKKHSNLVEENQYYCTTCQTGYKTRKSLLAHKRNASNHQFTLFECPICSRTCPNQHSLASHIQAVHSTSKDYVCAHCPARYTNRKSLVRHMGTHSCKGAPKVAICHLCGNSYKSNNKLNRHLREVCEKLKLEEQLASQDMFDF